LSFQQLTGSHTGALLAQKVLDALNDFDLAEKLFCITTDNASNNYKLMKCLRKLLKRQGIVWSAQRNHVNCMNHVLNLAVQAFLKKIKVLAPAIDEDIVWMEKDDERDQNSDEEEEEEEQDTIDEEGDEDENISEKGDVLELEEDLENDPFFEDNFQTTMKKLRGTGKVTNPMDRSAQIERAECVGVDLCATNFGTRTNE
jgi:hypothetical protein